MALMLLLKKVDINANRMSKCENQTTVEEHLPQYIISYITIMIYILKLNKHESFLKDMPFILKGLFTAGINTTFVVV